MIGDHIDVRIAGGLDVSLPRMVHVRQKFLTPKVASVTQAVIDEFKRPEVRAKIRPGMTIAVGCGSRGIANVAEIDLTEAIMAKYGSGCPGCKQFICVCPNAEKP